MTKEQAAGLLNGSEYGSEGTTALWAQMKAAGLVAVFGASDDLMEFRGAIDDEEGASAVYVTSKGLLKNDCDDDRCPHFLKLQKTATTIKPLWCKGGTPWTYETAIPHATFKVTEDGEPYCQGIVFALADVPSPAAAPAPKPVLECLAFFASCIKSGEAWSPACEEMYTKAKDSAGIPF